MRFTLGTDASTLTHPVQLCLASILMIMPSTYKKCIHFLSSKTVTSGYDSLRKGFLERTDIIASGDTIMLEGHGVDHLARREHVGLQRGEGRF